MQYIFHRFFFLPVAFGYRLCMTSLFFTIPELCIFTNCIDSDSSKEDDDSADPDYVAGHDEMLLINVNEDDPTTILGELNKANSNDKEANNNQQPAVVSDVNSI